MRFQTMKLRFATALALTLAVPESALSGIPEYLPEPPYSAPAAVLKWLCIPGPHYITCDPKYVNPGPIGPGSRNVFFESYHNPPLCSDNALLWVELDPVANRVVMTITRN